MTVLPTPPLRPEAPRPGPRWHHDALERDRFLDQEGGPEERAARQADLEADPAAAARVARRGAFLSVLRRLGRPSQEPAALGALRRSVEQALADERRRLRGSRLWRRLRPALAVAAGLAVALGVGLGRSGGREAEALDPVDLAARLLTWRPKGMESPEGCAGGPGGDVHAFALVQQGELEVRGCAASPDGSGASVAVLRRPEELPIVGYVAVPAPGVHARSEVGITELEEGRVVVFDVLDHGRRIYLAVDPQSLRLRRPGADNRWSCAACHGPARQELANPHHIVLRRNR